MNQILTMNRKLRRDTRGVTAIEYGLLVALIIIACIAALSLTGTNAKKVFVDLGNAISATFTPVDAFANFATGESTLYEGSCGSRSADGYMDSSGDFLSLVSCSPTGSQSTIYNEMNNATDLQVYNVNNGKITIPPADGNGSGFTVSNRGNYIVRLFKQGSGSNSSFFVYTYNSTISSADLNNVTAACTAEGGTVTRSGAFTYCNGGKLYSNNLASQLIPSSAQ